MTNENQALPRWDSMTEKMKRRYSQMMDIARCDENIRGVVLYGSMVNENVKPDMFQDFDVYFIASDVNGFNVEVFSEVALMFNPSINYPELFEGEAAYLMLFEDDTRIDLVICTHDIFMKRHSKEYPMKTLLDKDSNLPNTNLSLAEENIIKPISEKRFSEVCTEFIWELQNSAKGIVRDELSFAVFFRDIGVRDMLNIIIDSYIGMKNDYSISVGSLGKFRKHFLTEQQYQLYAKTYLTNNAEDIWASLFNMVEMFRELGTCIAKKYCFHFPEKELDYMKDHLMRIKTGEMFNN